jgi:hypothetical protein
MSIERWVPKYVTANAAGDIEIKGAPGKVAELLVETAGLTCYLKDGDDQVYSGLTGIDQDYFVESPLTFNKSIVINFSEAGSASIVYL